jgi:hypothetical protein
MGTTIVIVISAVIVAAVFAMLITLRLNVAETAKQRRKKPQEQENDAQADIWADALVIESNDVFENDKARVTLTLEVIPLQRAPFRASTVWLVDAGALHLVAPGRHVTVKIGADRHTVSPAVKWASSVAIE